MKKSLLTPLVALSIMLAGAQTPAEQPAAVSIEPSPGTMFSTRGADGLYRLASSPRPDGPRADASDSITLTVSWSLRNKAPGNITDVPNYLQITRSDGIYGLVGQSALKNAPNKTLALRLPTGEYMVMMYFDTDRPEYASGATIVAREHLQLQSDTTLFFNPEEATRMVGIRYTLEDGSDLRLPDKLSSTSYNREGANIYGLSIIRRVLHVYNRNAGMQVNYGAQYNYTGITGSNRERSGDVRVNPGLSEDFLIQCEANWSRIDSVEVKAHPSRPPYYSIFPEMSIPAADTVYTCPAWTLHTLPAPVAHSPAPQATTTYKYSYKILTPGFNTFNYGYSNADNGAVFFSGPISETPFSYLSMGTVEANTNILISSMNGYGIQLPPVVRRPDGGSEYAFAENLGDTQPHSLVVNSVMDSLRSHARFSYPVEGQNPEFGNTAPILSLPWLTQKPTTTGYYGTAPLPTMMCPTYLGNGGERRDIDRLLITILITADGDTVWNNNYRNFRRQGASHFAQPHETPHRVRYMFRNSNVMVDSIAGFSNTDLEFTENTPDAIPPTLQMMQMRDAQGKVTVKFDRLADATIMLAGGDFHYDWNVGHFVCGPVTLKVEAARRGSTNFTELTSTEDASAFHMPVFGHFWTVRPSEKPLASRDGWFDLRITMTDAAGNTNVQHISPAFYASDAAGAALVGDDAALTLSGSVLCAEGMEISVYNVAGAPVGRAAGTFDTATLPAGVYIATAGGKTLKFIR